MGDELEASKKSQDLVAEEELGLVGVDVRDGMPRAVVEENPVRDEGMNVRIPLEGGLGEMLRSLASTGVKVPDGFATTTDAFHAFLASAGLESRLHETLADLDVDDVSALTRAGRDIRGAVLAAELPEDICHEVREAYRVIAGGDRERSFAVRSSATAEDMPDASFAGQQETFLNVRGEDEVLLAIKGVFASLFNDRAIAYRVHKGFRHEDVGISAGVQLMVRSDLAASGVATRTGSR